MELANIIIGAVNVLLTIVLTVLIIKKSKVKNDINLEVLQEAISILKEEINREAIMTRENTATSLNFQNNNIQNSLNIYRDNLEENIRASEERTEALSKVVAENLNQIRIEVKCSLNEVRENNDKQLEKMRETVDEKLSATVDQRFKQSFAIVSERLDAITKGFGEMQNLTNGMDDLKRVLSNIKSRGTWGEASLDYMLSQILAPEQFDRNVRISRSENADVVDFVINLPGTSDNKVWLPIDAKFPFEDYQRIVDATDETTLAEARHALEVRLRSEAISIKNKYIKVPKTTDFAILYLPIEGLFNEAVSIRGLCDELQNKHRIILCGPTTLAALLNSLQMGFRSVAIEKRTSEIYKLLNAFKRDFQTFCNILENTQRKLGEVTKQINKASDRTRIIQNKLDRVQSIAGEPDEISDGQSEDNDED